MPDFSGSRIDHLNLPVTDLAASVAFYEAALAPLGITTLFPVAADEAADQKAMHAFGVHPKPFPEYHPGYYGAFVADPDGVNVEAVCHGAPVPG